MLWYFAYGSNMNPARMRERVGDWHARMPGRLPGFRLAFDKRAAHPEGAGFANIAPEAGGVVEGVLYRLDEAALEKLDGYEGYPGHYGREEMEVRCDDGVVRAWVYVAMPARTEEGLRPTREYLEHLLAGRNFLSDDYYRMLLETPTLD